MRAVGETVPVDRAEAGGGSEMEGASVEEERKESESVSYRYWVREATGDAAPAPVPRKLSPQDVVPESQSPATLGSVWNKVVLGPVFVSVSDWLLLLRYGIVTLRMMGSVGAFLFLFWLKKFCGFCFWVRLELGRRKTSTNGLQIGFRSVCCLQFLLSHSSDKMLHVFLE